jgi:signal transduction histidine kinase
VPLCDAHSAGISLLEGDVFRWEAVAGVLAAERGRTTPRVQSPSGVCIERGTTQLMRLVSRCFPALSAEPPIVEMLLFPFYDHGQPIGTVWIVSHTEERTFDREDARLVRVLSQFASAAWQLWKGAELVAAASVRKDAFLATIGHELRNPLGAILSASAVLRQDLSGNATLSPAAETIARQATHMSRLLDDLLDVARIESGKLQLLRQTVDVRSVVAETLATRREQLERRQHSLTIELGPDPLLVEADPVRLAQVLSNLVDNAAKYTPARGKVRVAAAREGDHVALTVSDTGVGVPADRVQSIFEPFAQLTESRDASDGGMGLGLALVRSLTELHGGTVQVASDGPDRGSTFTVRWPIKQVPAGFEAGV